MKIPTIEQERGILERTSRYITKQLDQIEQTPAMWGPPLAVELQYLQLLEFLVVVQAPKLDVNEPRLVRDLWVDYLRYKHPGFSTPLIVSLREMRCIVEDRIVSSSLNEK